MGQVIGGIVAETQAQAQKAAQLVKVTYEDLPRIITIEVKCSLLHGFYISDAKGGGFSFFFFFFANARNMLKASHAWEEGIFRAAPLVRVSLYALASCLPRACLAFTAPLLAWKRKRKCRLSCRLI